MIDMEVRARCPHARSHASAEHCRSRVCVLHKLLCLRGYHQTEGVIILHMSNESHRGNSNAQIILEH